LRGVWIEVAEDRLAQSPLHELGGLTQGNRRPLTNPSTLPFYLARALSLPLALHSVHRRSFIIERAARATTLMAASSSKVQ
jgi:hypothetical protein